MLADVKGHRRCGQTNAESIHDMGKVLLVFMDPTRLVGLAECSPQ